MLSNTKMIVFPRLFNLGQSGLYIDFLSCGLSLYTGCMEYIEQEAVVKDTQRKLPSYAHCCERYIVSMFCVYLQKSKDLPASSTKRPSDLISKAFNADEDVSECMDDSSCLAEF